MNTTKALSSLDHLSYSSIMSYLACPRAWKFKYLEGQPTISSPELVLGSAVHGAIESYLLSDRTVTPMSFFNTAWEQALQRDGHITWGEATPEQVCNEGVRLLNNDTVLYNLNTISLGQAPDKSYLVEQKITLCVPGVPIPIIGYIDLQTADYVPGDIKTSSRSWTQERAQNETQSLFYLAALNQAGWHDHAWRFRHYVLVKTKTPQFQIFEHRHQPGEAIWLFGMIKSVWKGIKAGVYPENPGSWKCSESYCDFWKICRGKYVQTTAASANLS